MDFFKMNRINKISQTHYEMISDALIVQNIVNLQDAKRNLPTDQFRQLMSEFEEIMGDKEEYRTNSVMYENRAIQIVYRLEGETGASYDRFCGDAYDILRVYSNKKDMLDNLQKEEYSQVISLINLFSEESTLDYATIYVKTLVFYNDMFDGIFSVFNNYEKDYFFRYVKHNVRSVLLYNYFDILNGDSETLKITGGLVRRLGQNAMRRSTASKGFIDLFITFFLIEIKLSDNQECRDKLREFIYSHVHSLYNS